jgi:hypothetical protein
VTRSLRRMTALAGIGAALAAAGPVASATAATLPVPSNPVPVLSTNQLPVLNNLLPWSWPGTGQQPAGSCGANQGLPPGIVNLGPTGPLGPLGPHGPLGAGHLPCGSSMFDLGPSGPLGPGGALGSLYGG